MISKETIALVAAQLTSIIAEYDGTQGHSVNADRVVKIYDQLLDRVATVHGMPVPRP